MIDYTPYEGMQVTGWPVTTIRRGELAMHDGKIMAALGSRQYLPGALNDLIRPAGGLPLGFDVRAYKV